MKQLYTTNIDQDVEAPYSHLAIDLNTTDLVSLYPEKQSLLYTIISNHIFIPGDIRIPSLYSIPNNIDYFPHTPSSLYINVSLNPLSYPNNHGYYLSRVIP